MEDFLKCIPGFALIISVFSIPLLIILSVWGLIDAEVFIKLIVTDLIVLVVSILLCEILYGE